jgi:hypothetical protein
MNRYSATIALELLSAQDESFVFAQLELLAKELLLGVANDHVGVVGAHVISVHPVIEQESTMKALVQGVK